LNSVPVEAIARYDVPSSSCCPRSILNFVINSLQPVICADASQNPVFSSDPFVQQHNIRSVAALPLIQRGRLDGMLYLDSRSHCGLFNADKMILFQLIASQSASSLENARLYEAQKNAARTLEEKIKERTKQLELATEAALEASRSKSAFLASMSHEIRTPSQFFVR